MSNPDHATEKPRNATEQRKLEAAIRHLYEHQITFNQILGFEVGELGEDRVSVNFAMKPELIGHYLHQRLHGGVIAAVLDATAGLTVMWSMVNRYPGESVDQVMARFRPLGTIDLRIDYLRPGIGENFMARAETTRLGRRIASTNMTLHNENGELLSTGAAAYIVS